MSWIFLNSLSCAFTSWIPARFFSPPLSICCLLCHLHLCILTGRARQLMYAERVSSIVHGHLNLELKSALGDVSKSKAHDNRFALPQIHCLQLGGVVHPKSCTFHIIIVVGGVTAYSSFVEKQWASNTRLIEKQKVKPHTRWIIDGLSFRWQNQNKYPT